MTDLSAWIGRTERRRDYVSRSAINRFLAVFGGEKKEAAPPGFHWTICTPDTPQTGLSIDGHAKKGGFLPPVALPRRMWASSDIKFHADIEDAAEIDRISKIASIKEKTGKSGTLVFVEIIHDTMADGALAVHEQQTVVYREAANIKAPLPEAAGADITGWDDFETVTPDEKLLFRYSALTFNGHRIHYDLDYARDVEFYPGLVVHGPLMASLLMRLASRRGALRQFSFRAASPAFCGQPLHLVASWSNGQGVLKAIGGDGRTIIEAHAKLR